MRKKLIRVMEMELGIKATIHGIRWHYSHPLEREIDIEIPGMVDKEMVKEVIVKSPRIGFQTWEIKGAVVEDWVEIVIPDLDGGKRGERGS